MRFTAAFAALIGVLALTTTAEAQVAVQGYTRSDGTYVAPHYRSAPDSTTSNNWSTQGNSNPYTGQAGTKPYNPYEPYKPPVYGTP